MKSKIYLGVSALTLILLAGCKSVSDLSLKKALKEDFLIGVAVNTNQTDDRDSKDGKLICKHFNSIVAENCMKSEVIHPDQNRYNFEQADKFVEFGQKNKMQIMGHVLIWHSQLSRWFCVDNEGKTVSRDTLINRMRDHIQTIMRHYKGKIKGWDVINEAFEDDGSYRQTPFYQIIGEDYIPLAFEFAHEADPDAELYYNDFSMFKPKKCDAVVRMVNKLKNRGIRIDAVGMQGHYLINDPSIDEVETSIVKFAASGVKVNITEFDLSVLPLPEHYGGADVNSRLDYNKKYNPYANGILSDSMALRWDKKMLDFFKMFLKHKDCMERVTMWGLNDGESWKNNWPIPGRTDFPLLFDRNDNPKPVVKQIIDIAKHY